MPLTLRPIQGRTVQPIFINNATQANILDGVSMGNLIGLLQQLSDLSDYSKEIFEDLLVNTNKVSKRVGNLKTRMNNFENILPEIEKIFNETDPLEFYLADKAGEYKRKDNIRGNLITSHNIPISMNERRKQAEALPPFEKIDNVLEVVKDAPPVQSCAVSYSNPHFFIEEWARGEAEKQLKLQEEKKLKKQLKKKKKKDLPVEKKNVEAVKIKQYNSFGEEFLIGAANSSSGASDKVKSRVRVGSCIRSEVIQQNINATHVRHPSTNRVVAVAMSANAIIESGGIQPRHQNRVSVSDIKRVNHRPNDSVHLLNAIAEENEEEEREAPSLDRMKSIPARMHHTAPSADFSTVLTSIAHDNKLPKSSPPISPRSRGVSHIGPPMGGPPIGTGGPPTASMSGPPIGAMSGPPVGAMSGPPIGAMSGPPVGAMSGPPIGAMSGPPKGAMSGPPIGAMSGPPVGVNSSGPPPVNRSAPPPQTEGRGGLLSAISKGGFQLKKVNRDEVKATPPPQDSRSGLLSQIKTGIQLKKSTPVTAPPPKPAAVSNSIMDILARRAAVAAESDDDDDDDEWD